MGNCVPFRHLKDFRKNYWLGAGSSQSTWKAAQDPVGGVTTHCLRQTALGKDGMLWTSLKNAFRVRLVLFKTEWNSSWNIGLRGGVEAWVPIPVGQSLFLFSQPASQFFYFKCCNCENTTIVIQKTQGNISEFNDQTSKVLQELEKINWSYYIYLG